MTDPTDDDTAVFTGTTGNVDAALAGVTSEQAEELSARARTQRRLTQARSAVSDASIRARARRTPTLPTEHETGTTDDSAPSRLNTMTDNVLAYRTYILGAAAAVFALIAVARKRRSSTREPEERVDLGDWHLSAEPLEDEG